MEIKKQKIQILLSTYNGEKYLREQLESYIALENFDDVKVLIRDDGSTDGTLEILHEYKVKYGFEIIEGKNIGLNASMYELMKLRDTSCCYFSFSDQDDVWLKNKLTRGISALEKYGTSPALYVACSNLTDGDLNITGHTFIPKRPLTFYNAMIQNVCPGHAQICNRTLAEKICGRYSEYMMVFDYWVYLIASAVGEVIFDPEPTTYYRQHGLNAIGCEYSKLKVLKTRINRVKTKVSADNAKQLNAFCDVCSDIIPENYKIECDKFFKNQKNFFTRLCYIFSSKVYRQTSVETLIFRIMYLLGRYNI